MNQEIKKNWTKPELEILSKDTIKSGSVPSAPEGVHTGFGGTGSGS